MTEEKKREINGKGLRSKVTEVKEKRSSKQD